MLALRIENWKAGSFKGLFQKKSRLSPFLIPLGFYLCIFHAYERHRFTPGVPGYPQPGCSTQLAVSLYTSICCLLPWQALNSTLRSGSCFPASAKQERRTMTRQAKGDLFARSWLFSHFPVESMQPFCSVSETLQHWQHWSLAWRLYLIIMSSPFGCSVTPSDTVQLLHSLLGQRVQTCSFLR